MAVPKRKTSKAKSRTRRAANWQLDEPPRSVCPHCARAKTAARGLPELRVVQGSRRRRGRLSCTPGARCPSRSTRWAATGARRDRRGCEGRPSTSSASTSSWSGRPTRSGTRSASALVACTEVIAMDDDPAQSVRRKKDASLVRARRARARRRGVRDRLGRQHRRGHGRGAAAARADQGRGAAVHRDPHPAPGLDARHPLRRRRQRRVHAPRCSCSSPRWGARSRPAATASPSRGWGCSRSARSRRRARRS